MTTSDNKKLTEFKKNTAPCIETLGGKPIKFQSKPPYLEMEFVAIEEFTHSEGKIVQGGFVTGMLDAPMAHLLMYLFDEKIIPMTLDINVSFLAPTRQGNLTAIAEVIQLGGSTAFMASRLIQNNNLVATATSTVKIIRTE